jgi:hypothetical protein
MGRAARLGLRQADSGAGAWNSPWPRARGVMGCRAFGPLFMEWPVTAAREPQAVPALARIVGRGGAPLLALSGILQAWTPPERDQTHHFRRKRSSGPRLTGAPTLGVGLALGEAAAAAALGVGTSAWCQPAGLAHQWSRFSSCHFGTLGTGYKFSPKAGKSDTARIGPDTGAMPGWMTAESARR